jgi:type IV pilus assembly protein PilA
MSLMKLRRNRKGFTLIEMMIVIAVIAILAAVIIPKSGLVQNAAKESGVEANARVVQGIVEREKVRAVDANSLRDTLKEKLTDDAIQNPFTNKLGSNTEETISGDYAVAIATTTDGTKPAADAVDTTKNSGVVAVSIYEDLSVVKITPYGKDGSPIPNAHIIVE